MSLELSRQDIIRLPSSQSVIVEAGAGSGKTALLIERVKFLCEHLPHFNSKVACIAYTNVAADEIMSRLNSDNVRLSHCTYIGTMHSFLITYVIKPYGYLISKGGEQFTLLAPGFSKNIAQRVFPSSKKFNIPENVVALESIGYDENGTPTCLNNAHILQEECEMFKQYIHDENKIDQQDVVYLSYLILQKYPHIAKALSSTFTSFLVDEFQDITPYQNKIFDLFEESSLFLVGDPNQSIFGFTGADPKLFEQRKSQTAQFVHYQMLTNFRSTSNIVSFNNIKSSTQQVSGIHNDFRDSVWVIDDTDELSCALAIFHSKRLETGFEREHSQFLILAKTNKTVQMIQKIERGDESKRSPFLDKLKGQDRRRHDILSSLLIAARYYERNEYSKCFAYVERAISRIIFNSAPGFISLDHIMYDRIMWGRLQSAVLVWLVQHHKELKVGGIFHELKEFIKGFSDKYLGVKIGKKLSSLDYSWKNQKKDSGNLAVTDVMNEIILERAEDKQKYVSTIHGAKGLEATSVLVVAENDKELRRWLEPNSDHEDARIGYVAFSRARKLLCIWSPSVATKLKSELEGKVSYLAQNARNLP